MKHLESLLNKHPHHRHTDFQRLVQRAKTDPAAHWEELVTKASPVVWTLARRLAAGAGNREMAASTATAQVFAMLREDDYRRLRAYVGNGDFPSLLLRLLQQAPALAPAASGPQDSHDGIDDPDGPVPPLDPRVKDLLAEEGDRFLTAMRKVIGVLHRRDRLLLAMRYEQGLRLQELDQIFRLGTPGRVGSLLDRLAGHLQPLRAVAEAWSLDDGQRHAVLQHVVRELFAAHSFETDEDRPVAAAVQQR